MNSPAKYDAYKNTGISWLGDIPVHWILKKVGYCFSFGRGLGITKKDLGYEGIPCVTYGEIHSNDFFDIKIDKLKCLPEYYMLNNKNNLLKKGDFVFADTSEDLDGVGNCTHLNKDLKIFPGYHTVVLFRIIKILYYRYIAYLFESESFKDSLRSNVKGVKVYSITQLVLKNSMCIIPPINEQKAIAEFLDFKTGQIDALIAKQKKLLELLNLKISSTIHNATTDKNVQFVRFSYLTKMINRPIERKNTDVYTPIGLYNRGRGIFHKEKTLGQELGDSDFHYVKNGDLIFSGQFAWEGAVALAQNNDDGKIASHRYPIYVSAEPYNISIPYLYAYFKTHKGQFIMEECSRGSAGRNRPLNTHLLGKEYIPVPDIEKQMEIENLVYLQEKLKIETNQLINKLAEYRTSLITHAVTGKIKVI